MSKAEGIIKMRDAESTLVQSYWASLWQDVVDLVHPRQSQIFNKTVPGEDRSVRLLDDTAVFAGQEMTSGLFSAMFPIGQKAFGIKLRDRGVASNPSAQSWLLRATEITHDELYESNFCLTVSESLRGCAAAFGTSCTFSEFDTKNGRLNYRDFGIPNFLFREDHCGTVDTVFLTFRFTARQAVQEFGPENLSGELMKSMDELGREEELFEFIHYVAPRNERDHSKADNLNMPFESVYVEVKAKTVIKESGFDEMPFHVARWMKGDTEKWGRSQATESMATIRMLQKIVKNYIDLTNKYANPPLVVNEDFEGTPDMRPSAVNRFRDVNNAMRGMDQTILGNFPVTEKTVQVWQEKIHQRFFRDIFVQMADLQGDRRTTVEIRARIQEGLRRLASPAMRLQSELFTPLITRSVLLLIRNGKIPPPPPELAGKSFGIEYLGPLALALQSQQANGFIQLVSVGTQLSTVFPEVLDNVNVDKGFRRYGEMMGVNSEDLATAEEIAAKRKARADQVKMQQQAQAAQVMGQAYKNTSAAPDTGSVAAKMMESMGAG